MLKQILINQLAADQHNLQMAEMVIPENTKQKTIKERFITRLSKEIERGFIDLGKLTLDAGQRRIRNVEALKHGKIAYNEDKTL